MRARVLLWFCVILNVVLVGMVVLLSRDFLRENATVSVAVAPKPVTREVKTNVVIRRQAFSWNEIESSDYHVYIANLRRIGCPEKTIRDIIVADVNDLFAERIAREVVIPEQKWWLPDPDSEAMQAGIDQVRALEAEKFQMLTDLLGPDWNTPPRPNRPGNALHFDGPILSKLSPEVKSTIEEIEANAERSRADIIARARQQQKTADPAELARVQLEARRQLGSVLTPEQLEEYLLRYSHTADVMREQLRGFGADADEFRSIFRARDSFDQQIADAAGTDPASTQRRTELARMRDEAISQAIGPERYRLYQLTENPLFRQAQDQAQQSAAPADKVMPIFRINQAVQEETARIQNDRTLSDDQRRVALAAVQQQQQNSINRILSNTPADEMPAAQPVPARNPVAAPLPPFPPGAAVQP
jgi:hypothetical protein